MKIKIKNMVFIWKRELMSQRSKPIILDFTMGINELCKIIYI